ncbi:MAG: hypothetical protein IKR79_04350, partial [Bacteroidales bacterium]|nr:hypothetical protein [Bacteroidales bacterium]
MDTRGNFRLVQSGRSCFRFNVINENDSYLTPTVGATTATSASVSWVDTMPSTSWIFSYEKDEG